MVIPEITVQDENPRAIGQRGLIDGTVILLSLGFDCSSLIFRMPCVSFTQSTNSMEEASTVCKSSIVDEYMGLE